MLKHRCTVARNQAVGTNGRKAYSTVQSSVACLFLPMSSVASIQNGYSVGFSWDIYAKDGTDIQIGDRLTWNGKTYLVRGKQPFTGFGRVSYLKVSAETERANVQ